MSLQEVSLLFLQRIEDELFLLDVDAIRTHVPDFDFSGGITHIMNNIDNLCALIDQRASNANISTAYVKSIITHMSSTSLKNNQYIHLNMIEYPFICASIQECKPADMSESMWSQVTHIPGEISILSTRIKDVYMFNRIIL